MTADNFPDTEFWQRYRGAFSGVLKWQDMENLWANLKAKPEDWYVFDPMADAPTAPLNSAEFVSFLDEAEVLTNQRRDRPSCGSVYVDELEAPTYFKVFDPLKMGTSCGGSHDPIMPRWIISHMVPDTLPLPPLEKLSIVQRLMRRTA